MNHFTNQSNGSYRGHSLMGRAMLRRFALFFPMILLMLLFLPTRMVAQKAASSSKYIATYDSDTETLTFEKYEGESLPSDSESEWVEDGKSVFEMFGSFYLKDIKHIVINESFKTFTPTTLNGLFGGLVKLETITGLEYLNTANVTDMSLLFNNCQKLTSLDVTHFNTAKVTNMYRMFNACGLTSLDLSNFNTAKVENMELMFSGCSNLKTIYASDKFKTAAVTKSKNMFLGCSSLSGDIDWKSVKVSDKTYAKIDGGYFRDKAYDNRPWVKYADGTLTFRCGYKKILGENEYALNSDENLPAWNTHKDNITQVVFEASFANARPTTCCAWFKNFSELKKIEGIENLNTENVTSMAYMFSSCNKLAELDVTHFNTANVKNMEYMFEYCSGLTSLDVTNFNTANVTKMCAMFGRTSLTSLDVTHFNTANVKDMTNMFYACKGLTSLDVTNFNTANVTSMCGMFCKCDKLTSLDVTNFNTAKVTDMGYMFYSCHNLKEIYVSDKFVTDAVTNCYQMFVDCESLSGDIDWKSVKVSDKTYAKTDGGYFRDKAYDNRPWVKYADGTLTFRCGYKKTLGENEYALNSGEEKPAWYTLHDDINLVVFEASFANARPTSCYAWFQGFENLKQIEGIENLNTANVTDMSYMFKNCSNLAKLDVAHFNTAKVTTMNSMFTRCSNLAELDLTHFNTANVTNMYEMFNGCSNLVKLDVTNFNTAKVTTMFGMFNKCSNLTELDVTHFNTAKVTAMNGMFSGCSNLTELDLTHFNTENVTNMWIMFDGCSALTTIYVSDEFVITNITYKNYSLFYGCEKLKGAIKYNEGKTNYRFANYTTGYFTKLVGKNGDEKIGAAGETLATDNLVLDDDKDFVAYEPFAAKAASYSRTMKAGTIWATLCLPFAIVQSQETECKFYRLTGIDNDNECITLESCEGAEIPAGTPVLFKMNEGEQTLSISAQDAGIVTEPKAGTNTDVNLVGSFTKIGGKDNQGLADTDYIIGKDKFWRVSDLNDGKGVGIKPMRAYIHPATASQARAAMLSIGKGDGTTAIDNLNAISNDANAEYYDANGRRTNGLQKGLNIVKRGSKTYKIMVK